MSQQPQAIILEHSTIIIYKIKEKFGEKKITIETIDVIVKESIELVEKFRYSGADKREHVIAIVRAVIIDLVDDPEEERILLEIIDKKILEKIVDLIILASKGELDINNKTTQKNCGSYIKTTFIILVDAILHVINKCTRKPASSPLSPTSSSSSNVEEMSDIIIQFEKTKNQKLQPLPAETPAETPEPSETLEPLEPLETPPTSPTSK